MVDLKPSWSRVRFGDVVTLNTDRCADPVAAGIERYVGLEHIEPEDLRIRRWGLVEEGTTFTNRFRPGQVLFGKRRAYQRKVAVADFEGVCSSDIYVFEPKDDRLLPELLPFLCQTEAFYEHAVGTSAGSLSPRTNWTQLANYEFALPPLEEQRQIATALWAIQSVLNTYETAMGKAKYLVTSRIEDFIVSARRDHQSFAVGSLLREDPRNGISPQTNNIAVGLKTVSISAISEGEFIPTGNEKYAEIRRERASAFLVKKDDVFVVRGNGNRSLTGKCGIARTSYDDLFYPDLLIRLRFDRSKIDPQFAALQWNTPSVHRDLAARAKSTNGIWKVNGKDIREHKLLAPSLAAQEQLLGEVQEIKEGLENLRSRYHHVSRIKNEMLNVHLSMRT